MALELTPRGNRLHIGIFGRRNSGKSSLINALTNQPAALVSQVAGTTTDPVYKAMEINGLGPCVLIDTAGFDDEGDLGQARVKMTRDALQKTDIAILVITDTDFSLEREWLGLLRGQKTPVAAVINKGDLMENPEGLGAAVEKELGLTPILVSAKTRAGLPALIRELLRLLPEDFEAPSLVGELAGPGDLVLLVMPQDIQAPKGRLILPQVQVMRELLDKRCLVMSVTAQGLREGLSRLAAPPKLIITDSQCFPEVYAQKPPESLLTSFSVLMAAAKGDIRAFVAGAAAIDRLTGDSRVLIAEACTHLPLSEDIGRVKLPRLLRKKAGEALTVDVVGGADFPGDLSPYSLVIHCGACMFNRRYVLSRIERAKAQGVPVTNYGIALAKLAGILDKIEY